MRPMLLVLLAAVALVAEDRSVLFIGNSLTMRNNLPKMVFQLARDGHQGEVVCAGELVGGATLEKHWRDGKALEKIRSRRWTWVVLQEQSTGTIDRPAAFVANARLFIEAIRAQGAQPVLYLTWARLGEMPTQATISAAYRTLATETGALVVPAGEAFQAYRTAHGDESLFVDNRHPTPAGTYLAACSFYAVLFGTDPAGLPGDPAAGDSQELQRLAWAAARR